MSGACAALESQPGFYSPRRKCWVHCFLILPGRCSEGRLNCGKQCKIQTDPASSCLFESTSNRQGSGTQGKFSLSHARSTCVWKDPWAAMSGAGGEGFFLSVSGWCKEQFSAVLSSSWWCCVTSLSWHWGTGTLRGQTVLATTVTMGKQNRSGYGWGACSVQVQWAHPKSFATHLILCGKGELLIPSLHHKDLWEHPAALSYRTSSFLWLPSCKRCFNLLSVQCSAHHTAAAYAWSFVL